MKTRVIISFIAVLIFSVGALSAATKSTAALPLNINTATAQELSDTVPGIGKVKSQAIVDYRKAHGFFKSLEDVRHVHGIGPMILETMRKLNIQTTVPGGSQLKTPLPMSIPAPSSSKPVGNSAHP